MKNLQIYKSIESHIDTEVVGFCLDADNGLVYVLAKDATLWKIQTQKHDTKPDKIEFEIKGFADVLQTTTIVMIDYMVEGGSVYIVLKSGHFIRIGVYDYSPKTECLYKHEAEICSAKISPNQSLLVFADLNNDLVMMDNECTVRERSNALTNNRSKTRPVGVGWGSKETQFFGLDGRPSKETKLPDFAPMSDEEMAEMNQVESSPAFTKLKEFKNRNTAIDWRGDSQLFATLTYISEANKHYVKVWNRKLELQFMSEQLIDMESGIISWITDGKFIYCTQKRNPQSKDIVLFEKNGMIHQRFTLPYLKSLRNLHVRDMKWSAASDMLALLADHFIVEDGLVSVRPLLMLFIMQNFHYYIKFSTYLSKDSEHFIQWDPIYITKLQVMSSNGHFAEYDCNFDVTHSNDVSNVAVIDANRILITPLSCCRIPPPMSAITIELESLINKLAINPQRADNIFITTVDDTILYSCEEFKDNDESCQKKLIIKSAHEVFEKINFRSIKLKDAQLYQQIIPINKFCFIATKVVGIHCKVFRIVLPSKQNEVDIRIEEIASVVGKNVIKISTDQKEDPKDVALILEDRSVVMLNLMTGRLSPFFQFDPTLADLKCGFIQSQLVRVDSENYLITLGTEMSLRVNREVVVANCCISFRITDNYMIYTTATHRLYISAIPHLKTVSQTRLGAYSQPIEVDAALIVADESNSMVVVEMPRGNLEILQPRVLVIAHLTSLLDSKEYVVATRLAKRHRLNMNFICDYLIRLDVSIINEFANIIASHDTGLINLFITELENVDTIAGRYHEIMYFLPTRKVDLLAEMTKEMFDFEQKVNTICRTIKFPDDVQYLEPKILCLLNMQPPRIGDALHMVYELEESKRESALKFILYFVNETKLFEESLGTYSTDIAMMVAGVSNKDPKEYLALLETFDEEKNSDLRKYKMDLHIKRYSKAIKHLLKALQNQNLDDDSLTTKYVELIVSKRLYHDALCDLTQNDEGLKKLHEAVWVTYAEYLFDKHHHEESALAYSKAIDFNPDPVYLGNAIRCVQFNCDWTITAAMVQRFRGDESLKTKNFDRLRQQLMDRGECIPSLALRATDPVDEKFIARTIDLDHWYIAEYLQPECRPSITEAVSARSEVLRENLANELTQAKQHFRRLQELIDKYYKKKENEKNRGYYEDSMSTFDGSEVSSNPSSEGIGELLKPARSGASSIKTRKSNKSDSGERKKRINLKRGTRYEDLAIVMELKKFLKDQKSKQESASKMIAALFQYLPFKEASEKMKSIYRLIEDMLDFSDSLLEQLWPVSQLNDQKYCLLRRFQEDMNVLQAQTYENIDLEILMKPEIPREIKCFKM